MVVPRTTGARPAARRVGRARRPPGPTPGPPDVVPQNVRRATRAPEARAHPERRHDHARSRPGAVAASTHEGRIARLVMLAGVIWRTRWARELRRTRRARALAAASRQPPEDGRIGPGRRLGVPVWRSRRFGSAAIGHRRPRVVVVTDSETVPMATEHAHSSSLTRIRRDHGSGPWLDSHLSTTCPGTTASGALPRPARAWSHRHWFGPRLLSPRHRIRLRRGPASDRVRPPAVTTRTGRRGSITTGRPRW